MKIRSGFVSNSSSSSFVVYGSEIEFDPMDWVNMFKKKDPKWYDSLIREFKLEYCIDEIEDPEKLADDPDFEDFVYSQIDDQIYEQTNVLGNDYDYYNCDGTVIIGRRLRSIRDDETGAQFKESVLKTLSEHFGVKECFYYDEVKYDS